MPKPATEFEFLLYHLNGSVLTITLNRPENLNAFNDPMSFELQAALKQAEKDPTVRAVILTGAGRGFSAGQDLKSRSIAAQGGDVPHLGESIRKRYAPIISKLRHMEKPTIAMVNGVAAGAGASLAFACDLRVCSENAKFIQAFIKVGLIPDSGAAWLLPRLVGYGRALELALTGEPIDAATALSIGLVNRVVSDNELQAVTDSLAQQLASGPTRAIGLLKRAFNQAMTMDLDTFLNYESDLQEIAGRTDDYQEGVAAFSQKRSPAFQGR